AMTRCRTFACDPSPSPRCAILAQGGSRCDAPFVDFRPDQPRSILRIHPQIHASQRVRALGRSLAMAEMREALMQASSNGRMWTVEVVTKEVRIGTLDELDEAYQAGFIDLSTRVLAPGADRWSTLGELAGGDETVSETVDETVDEAVDEVAADAAPK